MFDNSTNCAGKISAIRESVSSESNNICCVNFSFRKKDLTKPVVEFFNTRCLFYSCSGAELVAEWLSRKLPGKELSVVVPHCASISCGRFVLLSCRTLFEVATQLGQEGG